MKWQQRVRVMTGLSCTQIALNLAVVALLVTGWLTHRLVMVGLGLCLLYCLMFVLMLLCQRQLHGRRRELVDFLEELTTRWYFATALIALWLLSKIVHQHLLLVALGVVMLAGPALVSLLAKDDKSASGDFSSEQDERR